MKWMRINKHFVCDPIIYSDRVHNILPIRLKAYVQSLPPCCKFNFPCKLTFCSGDVCLTLVATALDFLSTYPAPSAYISNSPIIWHVLLCYCSVEPSAIATYWKVR